MGCVSQFILLLMFIKRMSLTLSFAILLVENFLRCHLLGCLSVTQTNCQPHLDCHFVIHWPVVSQVHCISVDERCKKLKCHNRTTHSKVWEMCWAMCELATGQGVHKSEKFGSDGSRSSSKACEAAPCLARPPALHNFHSLSATCSLQSFLLKSTHLVVSF